MRWVVGALVVIAALAGSSSAEEIYRWKDPLGGLHFENVPTPARGSVLRDGFDPSETPDASGVSDAAGTSDTSSDVSGAPADVALGENGEPLDDATPKKKKLTPDEADTFSTDVSMRRSRLERELRGTESRLHEIDGRLAMLERARLKNSRGSEATGGVAALAQDVLSPEEAVLVEERDELAQRAVVVRNDAAHLRQEVEARLGTIPAWWTDLR